MGYIFIVTFGIIAVIYAVIASTTGILYRGKNPAKLSINEIEILQGSASAGTRMSVFFINLFSSIFSPPIYIIAGIITLLFYLLG